MKPADDSTAPSVAPPQPGAVLVTSRWNSWVRVLYTETGETTWVNLEQVDFETVPATGSAAGESG